MRKILRHRGVLAFLCVMAFLPAGCRTIRVADVDDCRGGMGSSDKNHPLICVDENNLGNPNPYSITVWDRQETPQRTPSDHPVIIRWATKNGGGRLGVEFLNKGCIEPGSLRCNGNGLCVAKTRKQKDQVSCDYNVNLDGREVDPVVIVQPCCL